MDSVDGNNDSGTLTISSDDSGTKFAMEVSSFFLIFSLNNIYFEGEKGHR
jgi:hypothetical protein